MQDQFLPPPVCNSESSPHTLNPGTPYVSIYSCVPTGNVPPKTIPEPERFQ